MDLLSVFRQRFPLYSPLSGAHCDSIQKNNGNMEELTKVQITAGKGDEITEKVLEQSIRSYILCVDFCKEDRYNDIGNT